MPNFDKRRGLEDMNSGREKALATQAERGVRFEDERNFLVVSDQDLRNEIKKAEKKKAPARIFEPKCKTCQHPYRDFIETMLVRGMTYKGIADRVTPPVDRRSIANHYKLHMDLEDAALRHILESEAKMAGENIEEGIRDAITKRGVLEVALRKGFEDVQNGVTTVEPRDLIQIAKLLGDMDQHAYQIGLDEMRAQVQIFIQAIKDVCDRDVQSEIAARVKILRGREGIQEEVERAMDNPAIAEIQEATVVEVA